jgi:hypothetical protein
MTYKNRTAAVLGICALAFLWIMSGSVACKKAGNVPGPNEAAAQGAGDQGLTIKEGVNEFSGTVKSAYGQYFYISEVPGFDIVVTGAVDNGDASVLLGKDVRVKAFFNRETPSVMVAQSIDIKESATQFKNVFNKTDTAVPADYFSQKARAEYGELKVTNINKSEDWEGKSKVKLFGKPIAAAAGKVTGISVFDEKENESFRVIVDNSTQFAEYYIKKLRLFDRFWFYLNIKESVDKKLRPKNKEIFHADVVFTGLY